MRKKQLIITIIALTIIITTLAVYKYVFLSEHRNIATEKASIALSANAIHAEFLKNEAEATKNYLDKVIEATGNITSVETIGITLNDKLQVTFNSTDISELQNGQTLTIKGRCVGYDELLEVVKIDQATLITK